MPYPHPVFLITILTVGVISYLRHACQISNPPLPLPLIRVKCVSYFVVIFPINKPTTSDLYFIKLEHHHKQIGTHLGLSPGLRDEEFSTERNCGQIF